MFRNKINTILGVLFLASLALGAALMIIDASEFDNPNFISANPEEF
jgi:hypothetical protein